MLRSSLLSVVTASCLFLGVPSLAADKDEMMAHYKAYQMAIEAGDRDSALSHAKEAWKTAEDVLGDDKTTGDLAQNYNNLLIRMDTEPKLDSFERAHELANLYPDDVKDAVRLERSVLLGMAYLANHRNRKAEKLAEAEIERAEAAGLGQSTFVAELKTTLAEVAVRTGDDEDIISRARAAQDAFKAADDGIQTAEHYKAALYEGYGLEGNDQDIEAALRYQEVMQDVEGLLPRDHPFLMRALGRWMTMRNQLSRQGKLDEALAAGMCECWPYDKKRNEAVQPERRIAPDMPDKAYQSGFTIVEFDLEDDGDTTNIRVLESWPGDIFEQSSRRAVAQWKYSPRIAEEQDSDRTDIITTIRYILKDRYGNVIE